MRKATSRAKESIGHSFYIFNTVLAMTVPTTNSIHCYALPLVEVITQCNEMRVKTLGISVMVEGY
jgi:hypothetical protein